MKKTLSLLIIIALFALTFGCSTGADEGGVSAVPNTPMQGGVVSEPIPSEYTFKSTYDNFGPHFANWLSARGYSFGDGGFGGYRTNAAPNAVKNVVIFIHGNSSRANGGGSDSDGWWNTYQYLRQKGWNNSELYAVNFGYEAMTMAAYNDHRSSFTNRVKDFINAVYAYVGYKKVTVIAHSLGVTVARKAMKDGNLYSKVKTFIGIAGGNHGLPTCGYVYGWYYFSFYPITPTCSSSTGFFHAPKGHYQYGSTSNFIGKLNSSYYGDDEMQGKTTRTYTITSAVDEIAGVRASYTSNLAGEYKTKKYYSVPYGHFGAKNLSEYYQWKMIEWTY